MKISFISDIDELSDHDFDRDFFRSVKGQQIFAANVISIGDSTLFEEMHYKSRGKSFWKKVKSFWKKYTKFEDC